MLIDTENRLVIARGDKTEKQAKGPKAINSQYRLWKPLQDGLQI